MLAQSADELSPPHISDPDSYLAGEINDDLLRMLFVCCDPAIATESQLVLALKVLCGFSVCEIALRLFISEANVYKRLGRGRERLRENSESFDERYGGLDESSACADPARLVAVMADLLRRCGDPKAQRYHEQAIKRLPTGRFKRR